MINKELKQNMSDKLYTLDTAISKVKNNKKIQDIFTKTINIGEAVVSILSNTGIAGFKFHVPQTEQVKMENDITDNFTDTNSAIQDHIALKPVTITLTGLHGEYFYSVNKIEDMLAKVVPTMSLVKQFLPKLAPATVQSKRKKAEAEAAKTTNNGAMLSGGIVAEKNEFNAIDLFKKFQELYKLKSAQTRAFFFFEALRKSRALFTVETSWKRFDNMAILSLVPKRDENADITDFTVTFKQINFAQSKSESIESYLNRYEQQMAKTVNKGIDKGKEVKLSEVDPFNPKHK